MAETEVEELVELLRERDELEQKLFEPVALRFRCTKCGGVYERKYTLSGLPYVRCPYCGVEHTTFIPTGYSTDWHFGSDVLEETEVQIPVNVEELGVVLYKDKHPEEWRRYEEIERRINTIIRGIVQRHNIKVVKMEKGFDSLTVKFSDGAVLTYAGGSCYLERRGIFSLADVYDLIYKLRGT